MTSTQYEIPEASRGGGPLLLRPSTRSRVPTQSRAPPRDRSPAVRSGICTLCVHAAGCTFPVLAGHPVRECLEFEGDTATYTVAARAKTVSASPSAIESSDRLLGLCRNCTERASCTFPRHEGGVWQCEEYS